MSSHRIETTVLDHVPHGHTGRSAYSAFSHQSDALAYVADDARWTGRLVVARIEDRVMGSLVVLRQVFASFGDPITATAREVVPELGAENSDRFLYCVSPHRLVGGATAREHLDREVTEAVLAEVYAAAAAHARHDALTPLALFTPADQLGALHAAWTPPAPPVLADFDHHLELPRGATFDSFVQGLPASARQTWRRDHRTAQDKQLQVEVLPVDDATLDELTPLLVAVQARNGTATVEALTRYRTRRWLAAEPGEQVVFGIRRAGRLLAGSVARVSGDTLHVREIGMVPDHEDRADLYVAAAYLHPTRWALERGLRRVELGRGHAYPKAARGSRQVPLWHVRGPAPA